MRKNGSPYTLVMDGMLRGFYKTEKEARASAITIQTNYNKSATKKRKLPLKIVYEQKGEPTRTIHEE